MKVQAAVACGAVLPAGQEPAADAADLSPHGHRDPRARVLLLLGPSVARGVAEADGRGGCEAEWTDLMRDLQRLQETHLRLRGKHFVVRSRTQGVVGPVVRCVGAQLPPTSRQKEAAASSPASQSARRSAQLRRRAPGKCLPDPHPSRACSARSVVPQPIFELVSTVK